MKTTNSGGSTKSLNRFAAGLCRLWSDLQKTDKYDRPLMAVGALEAVGFLLAALLAAGAVSAGCYALTGQPLGGNKQEPSPCEGEGDDCVYFSSNCPKGDSHCIYKPEDAGPGKDAKDSADNCAGDAGCLACQDPSVKHAKWPDGTCAGKCYIDICEMPELCKKYAPDAPPVCWSFCWYAKTWKCGTPVWGKGKMVLSANKILKDTCSLQGPGFAVGGMPGTPPPLMDEPNYSSASVFAEPDEDGKTLVMWFKGDSGKSTCTEVVE